MWNPPWSSRPLGSVGRGRSIVWHGSNSEFRSFDPAHVKKPGVYGPGFYFAERPDEASGLKHLYRAEIDLRSPLVIGPSHPPDSELVRLYSAFGITADRARAVLDRWRAGDKFGIRAHPVVLLTSGLAARFSNQDAVDRLKSLGYDSVVVDHRTMNAINSPAGPFYSGDWVAVFGPESVVSLEKES